MLNSLKNFLYHKKGAILKGILGGILLSLFTYYSALNFGYVAIFKLSTLNASLIVGGLLTLGNLAFNVRSFRNSVSVANDTKKQAMEKPTLVTEKFDEAKAKQRQELITEILSGQAENVKEKFKQLFSLRVHTQQTNVELLEMVENFNKKVGVLFDESLNDGGVNWEKEENIKALNPLMLEAVILTDAILARVENDVRETNVDFTAKEFSERLVRQQRDPGYSYFSYFMYSGIIDLYHAARAQFSYESMGENSNLRNRVRPIDQSFADKFYEEDKPQYNWRKLFNVATKHGFHARYNALCESPNTFDEQLKANDTQGGDSRFSLWTKPDTKEGREKFFASPGTRPT